MKCVDCKVGYCVYRSTNPQQECALQNTAGTIISKPSEGKKEFIVPEGTTMTVDWSSFRREAAKDILCALIAREDLVVRQDKRPGEIEVTDAICFADELIRQLKQK